MGYAAGQIAHRLHLLSLTELILQRVHFGFAFPLVSDISSECVDQASLGRRIPREAADRTILVPIAVLKSVNVYCRSRHHQGVLSRVQVVLDNEILIATTDRLLLAVSQDLSPGWVYCFEHPFEVRDYEQAARRTPHPVPLGGALGHATLQRFVQLAKAQLAFAKRHFDSGAFHCRPGALGDLFDKGHLALRPISGAGRNATNRPKRNILAFAQSRGDQGTDTKAAQVGQVAARKAFHLQRIVDHECPIQRNLESFGEVGQPHLRGQRGQTVVVHLMGKLADILRQPIDTDVAAIEPHMLEEQSEGSICNGIGAQFGPQCIAQTQ